MDIKQVDVSSIYRKKNIEKISSPEQLRDYIKVTTPPVWFVLLAIALLLVGALIWSVFGEIPIVTETGERVLVPPISLLF